MCNGRELEEGTKLLGRITLSPLDTMGIVALTAPNKSCFIPELRLKQASPWEVEPALEMKSFSLAGSLRAGSLPHNRGVDTGLRMHLKFFSWSQKAQE